MNTTRFGLTLAVLLGLTFLLGSPVAVGTSRADVVIFKDGFTLVGKVKREGQTIIEGGTQIKVGNGFFVIDDDQTLPDRRDALVRRIVFSFRHVQDVDEKVLNKDPQIVTLPQTLTPFSTATRMEPFGPILKVTAWDQNWDRTIEIQPLKQPAIATKQRITLLTPYAVWVESSRFLWQSMYLTTELGPDVVRQLLYSHPKLKEKPGEADPGKREQIVRFLRQATFYEAAEQELDQWLKDDPKQKERIDAERRHVRQLRASQLTDALERASKAGQHAWVQKQIADFPKESAGEKQVGRMLSLQDQYEKAEEALKDARRFLKELPPKVFPEEIRAVFTEAATTILAEANVDNYLRLETFITLAKQAERDRAQGKTPSQTAADLMALAVSGWVLGNGSAEAKADTGVRLWRARLFVQAYQRADGPATRQQLLTAYQRAVSDAIPFDEMAQLISNLPPSHPEPKIVQGYIPMEVETPLARRKGVGYVAQLPREYHHGRPYPVLLVLHQAIEKPGDALDRWAALAHDQGYILAAPAWPIKGTAPGGSYNFTSEEHAAVLDTLRDLQRRFNVDTDRVFLAGAGQGGDMAFDVGLSHPDVFAGVVVMGAQPRYFAKQYAVNGQYLPFYIVAGELASEAPKAIRDQLRLTSIPRGQPTFYVEYKGRGQEWFGGELPTIFDWMNRKKRATANPELAECWSMRPTDDRFYWVSGDGINPRSVNDVNAWKPLLAPATLQAKVAESNTLRVNAKNWKTVTLWLTRGMVDFDKPVSVWVGTELRMKEKKLTPSLATLLEDFYERGDRQRLFLAKIELPLTNR